jgi:hypothetical protein
VLPEPIHQPGTPPYSVPAFLDNPANGGNGDGLVCAHAFPDAVRDAFCANGRAGCLLVQLGLPLYNFVEANPRAGSDRSVGPRQLNFGAARRFTSNL